MRRIAALSLIIIISITIFLSCSNSNKGKVIELVVSDSLGWQEDVNYMVSTPSEIYSAKGELYVADDSNEIKVFNTDDMTFIAKFGETGQAPGEFQIPNSILKTPEGLLVVDFINGRIQSFDEDFKFVKSFKQFGPYSLFGNKDEVFLASHPLFKRAAIYRIEKDTLDMVLNIENIFAENDIQESAEKVFDALTVNEKLVISFGYANYMDVIDGGNRTRVDYRFEEGINSENVNHNDPHKYGNNILVLVVKALKTEEEPVLEYSLIEYDLNGTAQSIYKLPARQYYPFSWAFDGKNAYIYSMDTGCIYKFRLK